MMRMGDVPSPVDKTSFFSFFFFSASQQKKNRKPNSGFSGSTAKKCTADMLLQVQVRFTLTGSNADEAIVFTSILDGVQNGTYWCKMDEDQPKRTRSVFLLMHLCPYWCFLTLYP
jgi:hypothetical protein